MKYISEITVDIPRKDFVEKLDNPENMKHWQKGLVSYELLSQNPGKDGSQMRLSYKMGKRDLEMVETIIANKLPDSMHAMYETNGVKNIQKNSFVEEDGKTKWVSENEFQFSGLGLKLMGFLMPGMFKKQTMKYLEDFKAFAEEGKSLLDG
ncbi:MAG: SRPBCC family protein [Bacteroidota bacterium]